MAFRKSTKPSLLRQSFLATTGFAAGLFTVAAAALSSGEAKALTSCPFAGGVFTTPPPCAINTPYTEGDKTLTFLTAPPAVGSGTIDWNEAAPGIWQLDTDYTPIDSIGPANAIVECRIIIANPNAWFSTFQVDTAIIQALGSPTTLDVQIFSDQFITPAVVSATSTDGSNTGLINIPGQLTTIFVREILNVADGAVYDFGEVSFRQAVPGPLPLLGAGAAFGFSRKLRRRVNGARKLSLG